jgi:Tol biopolymer transport system component
VKPALARATAVIVLATCLAVACGDGSTEPHPTDRLEIAFGFALGDTMSNGELRLMSADGRTQRQLLTLPGPEYNPNWSPDGRVIMFARENASPLWVVNADGTGLRAMPTPPTFLGNARWSPDGASITFEYSTDGLSSWIGVMRTDGTGLRSVSGQSRVFDHSPSWSPSGRIAFTRQVSNLEWTIWTVNLDGTNPTRLMDGTYDVQPVWSPDGTRLLFQTELTPAPGVYETRIAVVNADGSGRQVLTPSIRDTQDANASWSPDGQWILYSHWTYTGGINCSFYRIPAAGGTPVPIVSDMPAGKCLGSSWRTPPVSGS